MAAEIYAKNATCAETNLWRTSQVDTFVRAEPIPADAVNVYNIRPVDLEAAAHAVVPRKQIFFALAAHRDLQCSTAQTQRVCSRGTAAHHRGKLSHLRGGHYRRRMPQRANTENQQWARSETFYENRSRESGSVLQHLAHYRNCFIRVLRTAKILYGSCSIPTAVSSAHCSRAVDQCALI